MTAQAIAGVPSYPTAKWSEISALVTSTLFTTFPSAPTAKGVQYLSVLQNITGGPRPMFNLGIAFGGTAFTYTIDGDATGSTTLNAAVLKLTADPDANRLRTDALRWIPKANGEFKIPVVSIHTLGDLFVPFSMEQVYAKRVAAKGNSSWLVQRAIRGVSHCDFTIAEQVEAFWPGSRPRCRRTPFRLRPAGGCRNGTPAGPSCGLRVARSASRGALPIRSG